MSIDNLKQLREETGISMMECKKALDEAKGDIKRAKEILRERGTDMVKGREGRKASVGAISSYIHANGKIGVLLELFSETDFVARSDEFKQLASDICLHIAAANPLFVSEDDIDEDVLEAEKKIYMKQFEGKKPEMVEKIVEGKLQKYKKEASLLSQAFVKDTQKTIQGVVDGVKAKTGENIIVGRFTRYEI